MRKITQQEAEQWMALAREYGFANEHGQFRLGRFITEPGPEGTIQIRFITPVPAGLYTEKDLRPKTPPIMFERTPNGEIILPGRWWSRPSSQAVS